MNYNEPLICRNSNKQKFKMIILFFTKIWEFTLYLVYLEI